MIHRREAMQRAQLDEKEAMTLEVRVARIESHVEHIQSDVTDVKLDVRELQQNVSGLKTDVVGVRTDMANVRTELKGDIAALALTVEKLRGTMRTALTAIIVIQVLTIGGAAGARLLGLL